MGLRAGIGHARPLSVLSAALQAPIAVGIPLEQRVLAGMAAQNTLTLNTCT
ncbi:hypothetical protein [Comamonas jiangduensis]|uniref:Uncharacterized protein n=1 Tax=Comamonas jiangduensis TaxID=1194168 RepID=A0ABV4IAQ6_9BURK